MWVADQWKEYEIIDCSKGEKLERWGDYILLRPDPQVLWDLPRKNPAWKKLNGHYHRSNKGGGEWEFFDLPKQWSINYKDLTFHLKPFTFKHTGLFPEQAVNWDFAREKIEQAAAPKTAVTCPYCGATTTPDASGCCEYCGGAVNG